MPTQTQRRGDPRYFVPHTMRGEMEFDAPDGERCRFPLMDISLDGASFSLPLRFDGIEAGAMLSNALIRVADLEIRGNLAVHHTTARFRSNYACGAQFYPSTDEDQNQLVGFIARLDARQKPRS